MSLCSVYVYFCSIHFVDTSFDATALHLFILVHFDFVGDFVVCVYAGTRTGDTKKIYSLIFSLILVAEVITNNDGQ